MELLFVYIVLVITWIFCYINWFVINIPFLIINRKFYREKKNILSKKNLFFSSIFSLAGINWWLRDLDPGAIQGMSSPTKSFNFSFGILISFPVFFWKLILTKFYNHCSVQPFLNQILWGDCLNPKWFI